MTRHPIDVIPSFVHLVLTSAHCIEFKRPIHEFKDWSKIVKTQTDLFKQFHEELVEQSKLTPTFFLNYEQLITDPESAIKKLFCFLLDVDSIQGTLVEKQIEAVAKLGSSANQMQSYRLKADTGRLCARKHYYSEELLDYINTNLRDYMHFWGYSNDGVHTSSTCFVTYKDQTP